MSSDSDNDFKIVGYAKRIPRTPRSKSALSRKAEPYLSPDRRLTPSTKSRLQRDYRLAIREGSPSPSSRKMKKEKHSTGSFSRSSASSGSNLTSLSSASSTATTPSNHRTSKRDSNRVQPWSDAENILLWKAMVKNGDGNVSWDEVTKIVNKVSSTTRTKSAVSQRWPKLRKEIEISLDPTNSASSSEENLRNQRRRSFTSSRADAPGSPSSSPALRSRNSSSTLKRE